MAEFASPVILLARGWVLLAGLSFFLGFHLITYALMSIHFLPHLICLVAAFTPWERLPQAIRRNDAPRVTPVVPSRHPELDR